MHRAVEARLELRGETATGARVEGYGSVFDTIDSYNDTIAPGAFARTLRDWKAKGKLPKMLLHHGGGGFGSRADDLVPVGRWTEIREDVYGLRVVGEIFDVDTARSRAITAALRSGELDGLSIGFRTVKSSTNDYTGVRTLTDIDLFEVSLVTFPANEPARVTAVRRRSSSACDRAADGVMEARARVLTLLERVEQHQAIDRVIESTESVNALIRRWLDGVEASL